MKTTDFKKQLLYVAAAPLALCGIMLMFCGILFKSAAYLCLFDALGAAHEIRQIK